MTSVGTVATLNNVTALGSSAVIDEQNPWPGLGAFDEAAERFFNGRGNETAELRRLVLHAPLTVLFAASGLGKTSLLQAGLFPLLRKEHFFPIYIRLDVGDSNAPLIEQVKFAFRSQLQAHRVEAPAFQAGESLWNYLHRNALELWSEQNQLLTPLFVFDQFEEVFTLGAENPEAISRLRVDLADLVENRMPALLAGSGDHSDASVAGLSLDSQRYKILLSFREDFLPALEGWKRDLPSILRNRLRLLPMSGEQAFEAVHTTASDLVDEATARHIVRFVAAAQEQETGTSGTDTEDIAELAVEPALLSLVCRGLNEKRRALGKAKFDEAFLSGNAQSIVSDYYNGTVGDLPDRVQRFIENELITGRGFRKPYDIDDARTRYGVTDQELRLLVNRRLLRIEPQRGSEQVELTHDLLTGVVREHRDLVQARERAWRQRKRILAAGAFAIFCLGIAGALAVLAFRARQSAEAARRSADIAAYNAFKAEKNLKLAKDKEDELEKNQEALKEATDDAISEKVEADNERTDAERQGHRAVSGQLALQGLENQAISSALQAALESYSLDKENKTSFEIQAALRQLVPAISIPMDRPGHTSNVAGVAFSPDGSRIATVGSQEWLQFALQPNDGIRIWEASSGKELVHIPVQPGDCTIEPRIVFTRGGDTLVCAGTTAIKGWSVVDGKPLFEKKPPAPSKNCHTLERIQQFAISADGRLMAVGLSCGSTIVLDTSAQSGAPDPPRFDGNRFAFTADGKRLATATADTVNLWDTGNDKVPLRLGGSGEAKNEHPDSSSVIINLAFSLDGRYLATATNSKITVWDTDSQRSIFTQPFQDKQMDSIAFSSDDNFVIAAGNGLMTIWRLSKAATVVGTWHYAFPVGSVQLILPSKYGDNRLALLGSPTNPYGYLLNSFSAEERLRYLPGSRAVSFSPDGELDAIAVGKSVKLQDPAGSLQLVLDRPEDMRAAAFSPNGKQVATVTVDDPSLASLRLWDVETGHQLWGVFNIKPAPAGSSSTIPTFGNKPPVTNLIFSPDGSLLATAGESGPPKLWSAVNGTLERPLFTKEAEPGKGETPKALDAIAFSPDGSMVAAAGEKGTVYFEKLSGEDALKPLSIGKDIESIAFNRDGSRLAVATTRCQTETDNASHRGRSTDDSYTVTLWTRSHGSRGWNDFKLQEPSQPGCYQDKVLAMKFGRDGKLVVLGGASMGMWEENGNRGGSWREIEQFRPTFGVSDRKRAFGFGESGELLATDDGSGGELAIWSTAPFDTQTKVFSSAHPSSPVADIAFTDKDSKVTFLDYDWNRATQSLVIEKLFQEATLRLLENDRIDCRHQERCAVWADAMNKIVDGNNQARNYRYDIALVSFRDAGKLDPELRLAGFDARRQMDGLANSDFNANATVRLDSLVRQGKMRVAKEIFDRNPVALRYTWNNICWRGTLAGHPKDVMDACEEAVRLDPENGSIRDSRGLARALTGDVSGAIGDFQFFIDHTTQADRKKQRLRWVTALQHGQNPFTPAELATLANQ